MIIPGAVSGARRYSREGLVRWPAVVATVPAGLVSAVLGGVAGEHVPGDGHLLQIATALPARALGLADGQGPLARCPPTSRWPRPTRPRRRSGDGAQRRAGPGDGELLRRYVAIGALAGGLSGLLGIGGGVIMVPAFVQAARMDVKAAIATSLVCVGAFAVPGTITHVLLDHVDWRVVAALVVGAVPGARIGAALTIRAAEGRLRATVVDLPRRHRGDLLRRRAPRPALTLSRRAASPSPAPRRASAR